MTKAKSSPITSSPGRAKVASSAGALSKQQQRWILAATSLALFMTNFDGTAGDIALPQVQQTFGTNIAGVQWFLNAYHLPVASLLLASGKLGDVFGQKRIFVWGLWLFLGASVLCGLAPGFEVLIGARFIQGIGAAAIIPLSLAILTASYPQPTARANAIGIWSAVSAIALVAGPGLGGLMIDQLGWRSVFFFNVPVGVVTLLLSGLYIVQRPVDGLKNLETSDRVDWLGLGLSAGAITLFTYSLTLDSAGPWLSAQRLGWLAITALAAGLFWSRQRVSQHPIISRAMAKNRRFFAICAVQLLVFFMSGGLFFILSLFLQRVQLYSAVKTGLCFLPMNGAIIAASFASGWIAAKRGWRFPVLSGLAIVTVALMSLTGISTDTTYAEIVSKLVLAGFGGGLAIPTLAAAAMSAVPANQEGTASALSSISIQMGGILGIAVQGAIFSQWLNARLGQSLGLLAISEEARRTILSNALQFLTGVPERLSDGLSISPLVLQGEIRVAFMTGLQATLWVAAIAVVVGIVIVVCVPSRGDGAGI